MSSAPPPPSPPPPPPPGPARTTTPSPPSEQPTIPEQTSPIARLHIHAFEQISPFLNLQDREHLSMTCRGFRHLLPPDQQQLFRDNEIHLNRCFSTEAYLTNVPRWRRDFHERYTRFRHLWQEGNIFHHRDVLICIRCLKVRPLSLFPMKLYIDDSPVCDDCIFSSFGAKFPSGHKLTYRGEDWYICTHCGVKKVGDEMHAHRDYWDETETLNFTALSPCVDGFQRLCERCHKRCCSDVLCGGWPGVRWSASGALAGWVELFQ